MHKIFRVILPIITALCLITAVGCKPDKATSYTPYSGPMLIMENIETHYSDSAILRVIVRAPVQHEMQNGNRVFPDGVHMEFFDESGVKSSDLVSNHGLFEKEKSLYTVKGNVIIKNLEKNERLNTEELKWKPDEKKIFTDKFVRIVTEDEILTGEGLTSNQDFSNYKILKPSGIFSINE
ncbi:MAG: LPS export ABC transporter periplasmic protein LptC [Cytophagaceae bacterium]